ncbi:oxygen-independent coproporphyrinogen III oxidase [Spiroplasma gladiatoris]|uniref:Heme chaperone HemW n=1 Tax=Spiroplasma gladiatoris TaxID=2143 RepID=A0A4P7AIH2_9MOLU|nr:radical SAM family heme chaperone HemW [Spiroplasma gladiatoris]QBQ07548.1 oxygen-independent coproporphyrinogen III oxidase [Spiroplasma gladiatoris]
MTKSQKLIDRKINSLYVHIPFCEHICFYCDFAKVIKPKDKKNIETYLNNLEVELNSYNDKLNDLETIYIGGGTPSCLDPIDTKRMLEILKKYSKNTNEFEYCIELNPESINEQNLILYKEYNINRLSIGIQTFDNDLLKKIGRIHDNSIAIEKYKLARFFGFENISIDLMYNLFNQKIEHIKTDIDFIKELKPDHISWYSLIIKDESIWGKKNFKKPLNDEYFDEHINKNLSSLGYQRYEISNYCLNQKFSKHNLNYWNNSLFVGVGFGASGFEQIEGKYYLTNNKGNVLNYKKQFELVSTQDYYFQIFMMGLRLVEGIDITLEKNILAYQYFEEKLNNIINKGWLVKEANFIKCTKKGYDILNEILVELL